jgi:hypothetical protein
MATRRSSSDSARQTAGGALAALRGALTRHRPHDSRVRTPAGVGPTPLVPRRDPPPDRRPDGRVRLSVEEAPGVEVIAPTSGAIGHDGEHEHSESAPVDHEG